MRILMLFTTILTFGVNIVTYHPAAYATVTDEGYIANKENIRNFFEGISARTGKPTIVSKIAARKQISGKFDLENPYYIIDTLSRQMGLIWYDDGKAIYIYDASEMRNALLSIKNVSTKEFNDFLKQTGLYDHRYEIKGGDSGTFYVSGPPIYVELVLHATKMLEQNNERIELDRNKIGIIDIKNTFVTDRTYELRGEKFVIPGLAKVVSTLLNTDIKELSASNVTTELASNQVPRKSSIPNRPELPLTEEESNDNELERLATSSGSISTDKINIIAYPDTNSLLVKGTVAQVNFVKKLVSALDVPKRHIELSLWIIDIDKSDLDKIGADWSGSMKLGSSKGITFNQSYSLSTLDGMQFIASVQALEQKKRAAVVSRPVVLTQENIPAIFDNNRTFYTKVVGERTATLEGVTYGTMISVLPRFAEGNQIELLINIEDGNETESNMKQNTENLPKVGRTLISTVARVPKGKSLLIGGYTRDVNTLENRKIPVLGDIPFIGGLFRYEGTNASNVIRIFLIEPREITEEFMHNATRVTADTRNMSSTMSDKKIFDDKMIQKWVQTYMNREKVGQ
ncbi:EscC/YscC/HrcC family type III secretion system outer membrane ring protein [Salmonella enterica]